MSPNFTSLSLYPMLVIVIETAVEGIEYLKLPLASVTVPFDVPVTTTTAPMTGSLLASTTVPVMVLFAGCDVIIGLLPATSACNGRGDMHNVATPKLHTALENFSFI